MLLADGCGDKNERPQIEKKNYLDKTFAFGKRIYADEENSKMGGIEMRKVRITILKTTLNKELAEEYGAPGLSVCPMMKEGQVFYADYAKPEGFCDEAWKSIYQYVFALAHGAENEVFYYGDWIRKPGVAICSCNDGLRPVIMKLEATKEEAGFHYTPIG